MNTEQLITVKELAQILAVSERTVHRLNSVGKIPAPVKIGGSLLWLRSEVQQFLGWHCTDRRSFEIHKQSRRQERRM